MRESFSVPAENQGVVEKGEASENEAPVQIYETRECPRFITWLRLAAIIIRISGEKPGCVENRRGNYCFMRELPSNRTERRRRIDNEGCSQGGSTKQTKMLTVSLNDSEDEGRTQ